MSELSKNDFEYVKIEVPKRFIGCWVITENFGTHGSYDIFSYHHMGMVFRTKKDIEAYIKDSIKEDVRSYYTPMKITKDYPIWQTRIYLCDLYEK